MATLPMALLATVSPIKDVALLKAVGSTPSPSEATSHLDRAQTAQTQIAQAEPTEEISPVPDGRYLYGEDPVPNRIGTAYMVFEVRHNRAVGAFYMPRSSFDCFYGRVSPHHLQVTVVNSYDRTAYEYAVVRDDSAIATTAEVAVAPEFEGFYRIDALSDRDRDILNTCATEFPRGFQGSVR
ncbi:hypothetical protein [Baaleninema sp.]|uniref:hypothetical protein n=1 Tax=Baaleninema sp. TaxID=3101197 RepID=UPI003D07A4A8